MIAADEQDLERIPVGIADFEQLRGLGMIYVDKTDLIYEITRFHSPVFLSRPRRFGKTLLTSTLHSLFLHGNRVFSGLKIGALWQEPLYKVLHLDFSSFKSKADTFEACLLDYIKLQCQDAGIAYDLNSSNPSGLINSITAIKNNNSPLVLLVDEYDCPLVANMDDANAFSQVREIIRDFFLTVKARATRFRFVFVTGIARFAQASVFSAPNSFTDISQDDRFAAVLGFTEQEIKEYFAPYIQRVADMTKDTPQGVLEQLKRHYDGFSFGKNLKQQVFNSWSVLKALKCELTDDKSQIYDSYWSYSGSFSMLMNFIHQACSQEDNIKLLSDLTKGQITYCLSRSELDLSTDLRRINPVLMLFLSGFLTFKAKEDDVYLLGLPNEEVRSYIAKNILISLRRLYEEQLLGKRQKIDKEALYAALVQSDCNAVALALGQCLNQLTYRQKEHLASEYDFSANIYLVLNCMGFAVKAEQQLLHGRTDLTLLFDFEGKKHCAVFEFKLMRDTDSNLSAEQISMKCKVLLEAAAQQIRENRYYQSGLPGTSPVCFAVVFSAKDKDVAAIKSVSFTVPAAKIQ